jgi:hypothetical protein
MSCTYPSCRHPPHRTALQDETIARLEKDVFYYKHRKAQL